MLVALLDFEPVMLFWFFWASGLSFQMPQWVTNGWPGSPSTSKHEFNVSKKPYWPTLEITLFPATQTLPNTTFIILHWHRWWQWCCPEDWLLCPDDLLKLAAWSNIQHNWRGRGTESVPISPQKLCQIQQRDLHMAEHKWGNVYIMP